MSGNYKFSLTMAKWFDTIRGHHFSTFLHIGALIHHLYVAFYITFVVDVGNYIHKYQYIRERFQFTYRFLTTWNLLLQCWYFSLCLAHDFLKMTDIKVLLKIKENIVRLRNFTFQVFAFPMALTVSVIFWSIFNVNRSFVFPPEAEFAVPSWCNYAIHTNVAIFMLLELLSTCHGYSHSKSRRTAIIGIIAITSLYYLCYIGTYFQHGVWLYPLWDFLNWSQRLLFMSCSYFVMVVSYLCGEGLSIKFWENTMPDIHVPQRKIQ